MTSGDDESTLSAASLACILATDRSSDSIDASFCWMDSPCWTISIWRASSVTWVTTVSKCMAQPFKLKESSPGQPKTPLQIDAYLGVLRTTQLRELEHLGGNGICSVGVGLAHRRAAALSTAFRLGDGRLAPYTAHVTRHASDKAQVAVRALRCRVV